MHYIALGPNCWGMGATRRLAILDAHDNLPRAEANPVFHVYAVEDDRAEITEQWIFANSQDADPPQLAGRFVAPAAEHI